MTTPVRRRGRSLRARLLGYITDAAARLRDAWRILTTAQARLLTALARIRPGRQAGPRIRAAVAEFNRAIAAFHREAGGFIDRWVSVDLALVYREGGLTLLDRAARPGGRFTWTRRHQAQVTLLSAQFFADLTARIQEAIRRARAFLRDAQTDAYARDAHFDPDVLLAQHRLDTVVYRDNSRHPVDAWAHAAITWQAVTTANTGAARTALDELGVTFLEVRDGPDCGWQSHDDPDKANRTLRTVQDALAHPTAHPHCQREFLPRLDLADRTTIRSGAAL
ncbi:hypothetical protein [Streptomyces sp. Da 82-17]|uniref:hypothetical protein n=1 Tax=Streptomyces sp. Da 82-17 TaxID=3377116 RepID=UPI0038D4F153